MLSKLSLVASTLGLAVVGTANVDVKTQYEIQRALTEAYSFETSNACMSKLHDLYDRHPNLIGNLKCSKS